MTALLVLYSKLPQTYNKDLIWCKDLSCGKPQKGKKIWKEKINFS